MPPCVPTACCAVLGAWEVQPQCVPTVSPAFLTHPAPCIPIPIMSPASPHPHYDSPCPLLLPHNISSIIPSPPQNHKIEWFGLKGTLRIIEFQPPVPQAGPPTSSNHHVPIVSPAPCSPCPFHHSHPPHVPPILSIPTASTTSPPAPHPHHFSTMSHPASPPCPSIIPSPPSFHHPIFPTSQPHHSVPRRAPHPAPLMPHTSLPPAHPTHPVGFLQPREGTC